MIRSFTPILVIVAATACAVFGLYLTSIYLQHYPIVGNPSWGGTTDGEAFLEVFLSGDGPLITLCFHALIVAWLIWLAHKGQRGLWLLTPWLVVTVTPLLLFALIPLGLVVVLHFWPIAMAGFSAGATLCVIMALWSLLERLDRPDVAETR